MTVKGRPRDAAKTRQTLLAAARRRFAEDGYAATTVREIAEDAGVNVALINRYFSSKEGLFEACLHAAGDDLRRTAGDVPLERVAEVIAQQVTGLAGGVLPSELVLLLRSSGDEKADQIRIGMLRASSERLAALAGWRPDQPAADELLLRAQVVLATAVGFSVLRSMTRLEPLASSSEQDLTGPMRDVVRALL
ncbi:helix-turn-helix domain-containing protein [Actinoplanes sp. NPDC051411]|uniref:TetR/AcrR family transcriptional regulator n=1 Tax=Actinoplanes sp. NPDC051411 TaxID=3155522 RepID=UPI00342C41B5